MKEYINLSSMTFWTGIGMVGFGISLIVQGQQDEGISKIMEGLGLIFLRRAVASVKGL
jgi:hypothetical protein